MKKMERNEENIATITFRLPLSLLHELDEYCRKSGVSRSELVRIAVAEYLKRKKKEQTKAEVVAIPRLRK